MNAEELFESFNRALHYCDEIMMVKNVHKNRGKAMRNAYHMMIYDGTVGRSTVKGVLPVSIWYAAKSADTDQAIAPLVAGHWSDITFIGDRTVIANKISPLTGMRMSTGQA